MSERYGRNQKRKARETISGLESQLLVTKKAEGEAISRARNAEYRAANARSEALQEYIRQHGMIDEAIQRIASELGRALGPRIMPHAQKLMDAQDQSRRHRAPIEFSVVDSMPDFSDARVLTLRGEIPALVYAMRLFS